MVYLGTREYLHVGKHWVRRASERGRDAAARTSNLIVRQRIRLVDLLELLQGENVKIPRGASVLEGGYVEAKGSEAGGGIDAALNTGDGECCHDGGEEQVAGKPKEAM